MSSQSSLILHIGASRTGTTTIQKHLLSKKLNNTLALTKNPYKASCVTGIHSETRAKVLINNISKCTAQRNFDYEEVFEAFALGSTKLSISRGRKLFKECLRISLQTAIKCNKRNIIFSSERLSETVASINGDYSLIAPTEEYPVFNICSTAKELGETILITVALRNPIKCLSSKYIRILIHRHQNGMRRLTPNEFIQKQAQLEINHPGTSALSTAMHSKFVKRLQKYSFVKAFGFQELLGSEDVFSLIGIQGEEKYRFQDLPRENISTLSNSDKRTIETLITEELKKSDFYNIIKKTQMFE